MNNGADYSSQLADQGLSMPRTAILREMLQVLEYWQAMPGAKRRAGLDPKGLGPSSLSRIALVRTLLDAPETARAAREEPGPTVDFRYELIGSLFGEYAPRLKPGALSSGIVAIDPTRTFVIDAQRRAARERAPLGMVLNYRDIEDIERACFNLILPLGLDQPIASDLLLALWAEVPALRPGERRIGVVIDDPESWLSNLEKD